MIARKPFLVVALGATALVLMAGRCSDDDTAHKDLPAGAGAAETPSALDGGHVDGGVEKDPLGGTMGGDQELDGKKDLQPGGADVDTPLDEAPAEPQPTPDEPAR